MILFNFLNSYENNADRKAATTKIGENLHLICADYCTNTGIIIFITTLIVTIIHLTLGASVYLYITKLKQTKKKPVPVHFKDVYLSMCLHCLLLLFFFHWKIKTNLTKKMFNVVCFFFGVNEWSLPLHFCIIIITMAVLICE